MTRGYTQIGLGDLCQDDEPEDDEPEDTRPLCWYCGNHYTDNDSNHCSFRCWHLDHLGDVKDQVLKWSHKGMNAAQTISLLSRNGWFRGMTDSTVGRWERAIKAQFDDK